jgi:hypothetical protein
MEPVFNTPMTEYGLAKCGVSHFVIDVTSKIWYDRIKHGFLASGTEKV